MQLFTMSNVLYYEFCNFQKVVNFKRKTSDNFYKKCFQKLEELKVENYQGVRGNFFGHLSKLIKIELHVNIDPTHTISNLIKYYLNYWMGERIPYNSQTLQKLMKQTKCHPCIYYENIDIPWIIEPDNRGLIDSKQ